MRKATIISFVIGIALCVGPLFSEETEHSDFTGKLIFGYRYVDNSGSEHKYREDINLSSGSRLMTLVLSYSPDKKQGKLVDEAVLSMDNFGGDPFERLAFHAVKHGVFTLNYQRIKADYFYADEQWTHPLTFWQMRSSVGGDYHTFDYERVIDRANAKIWLGKNAHFNFGFDRFLKSGHSTTTIDLYRDEFEFDKPIHQDSQQFVLSFDYSLPKVSITLEERIGSYEDSNTMFLPGFSEGENFGYPSPNFANMSYFVLNMPYDSTNLTHTARINARPMKNLILKGAVSLMNLEMDNLDYYEKALATSFDRSQANYTTTETAFDFTRKINLFAIDLSYLLSDRLALVAAAHSHTYHQEGHFATQTEEVLPKSSSSTTDERVEEEFSTFGFSLGAQFQATTCLTLSAGLRSESRTIKHEAPRADSETSHLGLYGNLAWRPNSKLNATLDYQYGSYEHQVMAILPAQMHRLRLNLRYKVETFFAQGVIHYTRIENNEDSLYNSNIIQDLNGFENNSLNLTLRLGHNSPKLNASLGWTLVQMKTSANDRRLDGATPYKPWPIFYEGDMTVLDLSASYKASERISLGLYAAYYAAPAYYGGYYVYVNSNETASSAQARFTQDESYRNRDLSRFTLKPSISLTLSNGMIMGLSYRMVDFKDPWVVHYTDATIGFNNDYRANVFEITLGYLWK